MITIGKKIYWHVYVYTTDTIPNPDNGVQSGQIGTLDTSSTGDITGSANDNIFAFKSCAFFKTFNLELDSSGDVVDSTAKGVRANDSSIAPGEIIFNLPSSDLISLFGNPILISNIADIINPQNRKPLKYALFATYNSADDNCVDKMAPDEWFSFENVPDTVATGDQATQLAAAMSPYLDRSSTGLDTGFFFKIKELSEIDFIGCCDISPGSGSGSGSGSSSSSESGSSSSSEGPPAADDIRLRSADLDTTYNNIWIVRQISDNRISSQRYTGFPLPSELLRGAISTVQGDDYEIEWEHAGFINFGEQVPKPYSKLQDTNAFTATPFALVDTATMSLGQMKDPRSGLPIDIQDIFWDTRGFLWAYCSGDCTDAGLPLTDGIIDITETTEGIYRLLPGGYAKTSVDIITCGSDGLATTPTVSGSHSNIFFDPIVGRCSKIACGEDYFTCFIGEDYGDLKFLKSPIYGMPDPTSDIKIAGYSGVKDIASGKDHACIIDSTGKLWAWGVNVNNAHIAGANTSAQLYTKVACGDEITLAIRTDNNIDIWTNDTAELVNTDYFEANKLKQKIQEYVDDPLNIIVSYAYSDIKCKGKMAAFKILFTLNDATTISKIALWGEFSNPDTAVVLNAGFSEDNTVIFLPDSDDSLDFACGYANYAHIKQDKSLVIVSDSTNEGTALSLAFNTLHAQNGSFSKIALAFKAGYLIESAQKKISQFISADAIPLKDLNRNTLAWQDATNSYEIVDCGLNHAAGQTIDGYVYKYNYARLIERSIIDIGTATNMLHKIAKLKDNPVTGESQSSKYLDGASFYRDATTSPPADIDIASMPIYIDSLKTIRNCQWMFKPYKVLGTRVSPGSFETPTPPITCMQASGSLIFAPLHYSNGSLGNDGFDYNLTNGDNKQASSKTLINESLINVNIVGGSYTITDTDLYFEKYNDTPDSIDFGYLSGQESTDREGASAAIPISINRYYNRIESVMNFSDLYMNQYSKIAIIKSNYYFKNATDENLSDKFIGNSASHLSGSNPYIGLINNTKIQRLTDDAASSLFATEIKASNTNIPRAEFMASSLNKSNYAGGPWRDEASISNPFTDYIKGYTLPYIVNGFKQCVPSNSNHTVASKLSFDIQDGGYSEDLYQFSMKWEDHLGATLNDLIADYGTEYAHFGTNTSSNFYMQWDTTNPPLQPPLYTSLPSVKWVGGSITAFIDKMSVMYNKTYGCVLEYGFDSTEVSSGTSGSKEISVCSKVMSVSDLIVGFWRLDPLTHNNKFKLIFDRLEVEYGKSVLNQYGPGSDPVPEYKRYRPTLGNRCAHLAGPSQINTTTVNYTTPVRDFTYNKCFIIFEFNVKSGTTTTVNKKYPFSKFSNFPGYGCTANTGSGQAVRKADFLAIDLREALSIEFFPACSLNFRPCKDDSTQPFKTSTTSFQYTEMMDHNVGFAYGITASTSPSLFYGGLWAPTTGVFPCLGFLGGGTNIQAWKFYVGIPEAFVNFSSMSVDPNSPDDTPVFALIPSALSTNGLSNQGKIMSERLIERASKCILLKTHSNTTPFADRTMFITANRVYNIGDDGLPIILDGESWNDFDYFSKTTRTISGVTETVIIGDGVKIEFAAQNRQQGFVWADGLLYRVQYNGTLKPLVTSIPISYNFNLVKGGVLTNIGADAADRTARNSAHILKTWRSGNLQAHSVGQYLVITNCISTTRTQGSGSSNTYDSDIRNYCVVYKINISNQNAASCDLVGMCDLDLINNIPSSFPQNGTDPAPHIGDEDSSNCYSYSSTISADGKDIFVSRHIINNFINSAENQKEPVCTETSCFTQVAISTDPKGYKYKANYSTKDVAGNFDSTTNLRSNPIISGIASQNRTKIDVIIQGPSTDTLPGGGGIDTNSRIVLVGSGYGVDPAGTTGSFFNLLEYNRSEVPPSYKECENLLADPTITPTLNSAFANLNFWASTPISARNGSQSATAFGTDIYVTSAGHSICLTPQQNSNNWTIKSISDFIIPTTTVHRFRSSYADLVEDLCNDLTGSCPIDEFETFSPPDITSPDSKNTSNIVRALTTVTDTNGIQKMIGVAHYLGTTSYTHTLSTKDFTRIYQNIPYLQRLNEVEKEDNETLKLNPSLRLFVNLFDSFTSPSTPFGINKAIGVNTINYFNMVPDFSKASFDFFTGKFNEYDALGLKRLFLTNYLGSLGDYYFVGGPPSSPISSCSDIVPRFGRDSSDKEGAITSLIQSDVGALIFCEGFQNRIPQSSVFKDKRVLCIRDILKDDEDLGPVKYDSEYTDNQFLPLTSASDTKSDFAKNINLIGSAELFTIDTDNIVKNKYILPSIFYNIAYGKPLLSPKLTITRGGSGSSSSHPDILKIKSNPFGFSLFSGVGPVMSPVGIFIDTTGFTMNHVGNSMIGISNLSINKEYLAQPEKFKGIPDFLYDSGSIFTSLPPSANPLYQNGPMPTTPLKSFYKYNQLLDMLNCMFDHQYGEVYKDEKISIATMQSLKDVYTGQSGATIVGYNESSTSTSVFLKNCVSITDLKKIRSWMSSRLSVALNKELPSSLLYGFDENIGSSGGTVITPGPIFNTSIVAQNIKYNNLVFATSANDLGINNQYWGYLNKIGWVDAVIAKLKTTIMSSGYYQIHIIDFKPGRSLSAHTEILRLLAEKSGGTYVPILTDPGN